MTCHPGMDIFYRRLCAGTCDVSRICQVAFSLEEAKFSDRNYEKSKATTLSAIIDYEFPMVALNTRYPPLQPVDYSLVEMCL